MKTTILKTFTIAILAIVVFSCDSDDDTNDAPVFDQEQFFDGYLTTSGFSQETFDFVNNSGIYEFGLEFTPTVTGKITSINVQLPATNNSLRVTIWDTDTEAVLRTEIINVSVANSDVVSDITDLQLVKDKKYAITMNSNDWYQRNKTDNTAITYPITVGSINIESYGYISGTEQLYPTSFSNFYYAGDLSFTFQQTE